MSNPRMEELRRELNELNDALEEAIKVGESARITELAERVKAIGDRLARVNRDGDRPRPRVAASTRQITVDALAELGVPVETKVLSRYVEARYGVDLPSSRFSSLRRDERRAGEAVLTRPGVVPALDASRFTPVTGMLALSTWPLEHRLVGPRSPRVYSLKVARSMLDRLDWLTDRNPEAAEKVGRMTAGLLQTVPGAMERLWAEIDIGTARSAIDAELDVLEADDTEARLEGADRAHHQLDVLEQLFGVDKLHVIEGTGR